MKLLLYCTKGKPYLTYDIDIDKIYYFIDELYDYQNTLNGKIVAECDFEVEEIFYKDGSLNQAELGILGFRTKHLYENDILSKSCLSYEQLSKYLRDSSPNGYAIHIKNLHIFDEPKELSDYYSIHNVGGMLLTDKLTKAPQNMQRVSIQEWEYGTYNANDIYVLISIQPQWICKILNGEKTIEIRKKVLKEML